MKKILVSLFAVGVFAGCNSPKPEATTEVAAEPKPIEISDAKYIEIGKKSLTSLAQGNVDDFVADYGDNAKFYWSGGDSLVTKSAILAYWKDRRANIIDTIAFKTDIWLPVKVNQGPPTPGIWLLSWADFSVRYKNGKSVNMWIHHVFHFDDNGKIDFATQYVDRAPIQAALAAK